MDIRKIEIGDSEKFLKMLKQLDNETDFMMYEPGERKTDTEEMKSYLKHINDTDSLILIAEENDRIIGFLSAERGAYSRIKHSAYIVVGILKDFRGRKIGKKLLSMLDAWAAKRNIKRLELTVMTHNDAAIHLYKKMGFRIEGLKEKSIMENGEYIDEYYMAKIY